jgi:hypothetical protein
MKGTTIVLLAAFFVAGLMASPGQASHGGFWRARDLPATSVGMGLDHDAHPVSTATDLSTGQVFHADVFWSGQQFSGPVVNGFLTIKLLDDAGLLVHQATFPAAEDISNVQWVQCPPGTGDPHADLETLPAYGVATPGILDLTGVQRNSFCGNFADPDDPYYFKSFSDYEGTYLLSSPDAVHAYRLHLHVRGLDHG